VSIIAGAGRRVGARAWLRRADAVLDAEGSIRAVALLRIAAGPILWLSLQPFVRLMNDDVYYGDRFNEPYWSWYPEVSKAAYFWLLRMALVAAVLVSLGLCTRVATVYAAGFFAWNLWLSTTHYHNNRAFLLMILVALAVVPSGRVLSLDALIARRRGRARDDRAPLWPVWLLRFELASVYGASGVSKLLDADWWGGTVTANRVVRSRSQLASSPLPDWFIDAIGNRGFHSVFAKFVILTEIFIALGLWLRASRALAIWMAVWFHVFIEISAHVQVFSIAGICALVIWARPETRQHTLTLTGDGRGVRRLAFVVRRLDWLARIEVVRAADPTAGAAASSAVVLDEPDGGRFSGRAATWRVLRYLPVTFMVALPVAWMLGRRGDVPHRTLTSERQLSTK
jgi:Vitamin K-dependent gamma-carboxylase